MVIVGTIEVICVGLIIFGRHQANIISTWTLLGIVLGAIYTHISVGDPLRVMGGTLAGLAFLLTRLYAMGELHIPENFHHHHHHVHDD